MTTTYRPSERGKAQALNDFLMFGTTASSSFLAAFLLDKYGWFTLNAIALVLIAIALVSVAWMRFQQRNTPAGA